MSAGFDIDGEVFWGTNGAIEAYVEAMAEQSAARFGADHPWTRFFNEQRDGFFSGKVVFLDELIRGAPSRADLVELLDLATAELARREVFTEFGRQWVAETIPALRKRIEIGGTAG
jgi:hypothetical protein